MVKALILAGGFATRLRPLSCSKPKLLFPIVGVPLVDMMVDWLKSAETSDVVLAVNHMADRLRNEIGETRNGVRIAYSVEKTPLGTGGPLRLAKRILGSKAPFLVVNGDIVTNLDLRSLIKAHEADRNVQATIALVTVQDRSPYGQVELEKDGKISNFSEKTKTATTPGLVNAGVYVLSPKVLERIPGDGMVSLERQVFPLLAKEGLLEGWVHSDGYWYDVGKVPDYVRVNRELLERNAVHSEVEGPTHIGKGSNVDATAKIGPYTILSDRVTVKAGVTIRDSIVFEDSLIEEHCHIEGSIIGERVRLGNDVRLGRGTIVAGEISIPPGRVYSSDSIVLNS